MGDNMSKKKWDHKISVGLFKSDGIDDWLTELENQDV